MPEVDIDTIRAKASSQKVPQREREGGVHGVIKCRTAQTETEKRRRRVGLKRPAGEVPEEEEGLHGLIKSPKKK
jgi:hypothetical protein